MQSELVAAIQKATIYDLEKQIEHDPKETYTKDEIIARLDAYLDALSG